MIHFSCLHLTVWQFYSYVLYKIVWGVKEAICIHENVSDKKHVFCFFSYKKDLIAGMKSDKGKKYIGIFVIIYGIYVLVSLILTKNI